MPAYNDRGARISPAGNQPYDSVYAHNRLPAPDDPGWGTHRHKASGSLARAIRVHGPFDFIGEAGQEEHCSDGWIALDTEGRPFVLPLAVYDDQFEVAE